MPAESELFRDKIEVSLDGRQIFYLFFGGSIIVALVFVLGVMVGKRVEARAHIERSVPSPVRDPLAALDALGQEEDLAFPAALSGSATSEGEKARPAALGALDEELLATGQPPDSVAGAARPEAAKAEAAKEEKARAEAAREAAKAEKARAEAARAEAARAEKARAEAARPAKAETSPTESAASGTQPRFTLQLSSFRDRAEADSFYAQLSAAGYQPYILEADVDGKGTWYRVRLGRYSSWQEAVDAKKAFESSTRTIAYVTRL